jgi:NAD(P)-dependent dehydrogenase (short-subunit alcohol dehydrogenase family)
MDLGLQGRKAFIAGSSSGIGAAIATALAREGVEIIVHGRSAANADAVVAEIHAAGGSATALTGQLDDPAAVERLAAAVLACGPIDILINSAGAASAGQDWFGGSIEAWAAQYQFSVIYAVQLIRALVPPMRARGWGRVLNISSAAGFKPMAMHPEYSAAKLGLHAVAVSLSQELGNSGVTANTLVSGLVRTENTLAVIQTSADRHGFAETGLALQQRVINEVWKVSIPMQRAGELSELAAAACFLVSAPAAYITGAALRIDGGASGFAN